MTDAEGHLPPPDPGRGPVAESGEIPLASGQFKGSESGADSPNMDEGTGGRPRLDWSPLTDSGSGRPGGGTATVSGFSFDLGAALARIGAELPAPEVPSQGSVAEPSAPPPPLPTRSAATAPPPIFDAPSVVASPAAGPSPAFNLAAALAETTAARRQQPAPSIEISAEPAGIERPSVADVMRRVSPPEVAPPPIEPSRLEPTSPITWPDEPSVPAIQRPALDDLPRRGAPPPVAAPAPPAPEVAPPPPTPVPRVPVAPVEPVVRAPEPTPEPVARTYVAPQHSVFDDRNQRPTATAITPSATPAAAPAREQFPTLPSAAAAPPSAAPVPTSAPTPNATPMPTQSDTPITPFGQELPSIPSLAIPTLPNLPPPAPARPAIAEPIVTAPAAPAAAATRAAQLRTAKKQKQQGSRFVLKAFLAIVLLAGLIAAALTVGRSRLFPSSWDPALTPIVDEVQRTRGADFDHTVPLVRQPIEEYRVTANRLLFGDDWVDLVPEWRALGLAAGDPNPERAGSEIGLRRMAIYDADADRIFMVSDADPSAVAVDLRVALEDAFAVQAGGSPSPVPGQLTLLGSPPQVVMQRAIERYLAERSVAGAAVATGEATGEATGQATADASTDVATVPGGVTAALPLPLEYELAAGETLGEALLRAAGIDPATASFASASVDQLPAGFGTAGVTTTAGVLAAGDRPLGDPVSVGVDAWSLVWGTSLGADTVDSLATAVTGDSYRAFDRGGTTCVAGVFESSAADSGFVLSAIGTWAAAAPPQSQATATALSDTLAQLVTCDPGAQAARAPQTSSVTSLLERQIARLAAAPALAATTEPSLVGP